MNKLMRLTLSLSFSGSIVILALFLLKPLLKRFVSHTFWYYLLAVAVLRLLLPFTPEVSLVGYLLDAAPAAVQHSPADIAPLPKAAAVKPADTVQPQSAAEPSGDDVVAPIVPPPGIPRMRLLGYLWLLVAGALLLRKLTGYLGFARFLWAQSGPVTNQEALAVYEQTAHALGIRRPPVLRVSKVVSSPLLLGVFRPAIIVTERQLTSLDNLPYVLRHELAHFRRNDFWYKWLFQLAVCIHWFNPLCYLLCRESTRSCELSCDETVARSLDGPERRAYGFVLLEALEYQSGDMPGTLFLPLCGDAKFIKKRLDLIAVTPKNAKLISVFSVVLALLFCCGAAFTGAYAADETQERAITAALDGGKMKSAARTPVPAAFSTNTKEAPSIEGYRILRDETIPLAGVKSISLDFSVEEVIVLPSKENVLRFIDYGRTSMTFAEKEYAQYQLAGGALTVKSGEWNKKWSTMPTDSWRQRVCIYLPAALDTNFSGSMISGSLRVNMPLSVKSARFSSASGNLTIESVTAAGACELDTISGKIVADKIAAQSGVLSCGSGDIQISALSVKEACNLDAISGKIVVDGDVSGGRCSITSGSATILAQDISARDALSIELISGNVTLGKIAGATCTLSNGSGKLQTGNIISRGKLELDNISGKVVLGSLTGTSCEISTGSGKLTMLDVSAANEMGLDALSGSIQLKNAKCKDFTLSTGSGEIRADSLSGQGDIDVMSGQANVGKLRLTGGLDLSAGSGEIAAELDRSIGVSLDGSANGSEHIDTFFELSYRFANKRKTGPCDFSGKSGPTPYRPITADVISGRIKLL